MPVFVSSAAAAAANGESHRVDKLTGLALAVLLLGHIEQSMRVQRESISGKSGKATKRLCRDAMLYVAQLVDRSRLAIEHFGVWRVSSRRSRCQPRAGCWWIVYSKTATRVALAEVGFSADASDKHPAQLHTSV